VRGKKKPTSEFGLVWLNGLSSSQNGQPKQPHTQLVHWWVLYHISRHKAFCMKLACYVSCSPKHICSLLWILSMPMLLIRSSFVVLHHLQILLPVCTSQLHTFSVAIVVVSWLVCENPIFSVQSLVVVVWEIWTSWCFEQRGKFGLWQRR
jgi:hypothetical protein